MVIIMESNPATVQRLATKYKVGTVLKSSRKDKKYMVLDPNDKLIHFGQRGYEDFTAHGDPARLRAFKSRNAKWKDAPKWSPAWLSYHLLWNDSI